MTGTLTAGSPIVTSLSSSAAGLQGNLVTGSGIQSGTYVQTVLSGTSVLLSQNALITATGVSLTFSNSALGLRALGTSTAGARCNLTVTSGSTGPVGSIKARVSAMAGGLFKLSGIQDVRVQNVGGVSGAKAFLTLTYASGAYQGLSVKDVIDQILLCWGIQVPQQAYPHQLKEAIHDMNAAFQMIWSYAKDADYFSRQTITLSFAAGVSVAQINVSVLSLLGPVRIQGTQLPLRPISSRSQFDAWNTIYLGGIDYSVQQGQPVAFFLERLNQPGPDNVNNLVHITPTPTANVTVLLDASIEPPRYLFSDYVQRTPVTFPNRYADSVLLAFCRKLATNSQYFTVPNRGPAIESDYQNALRIIGATDPQQKEVTYAEHASERGGK